MINQSDCVKDFIRTNWTRLDSSLPKLLKGPDRDDILIFLKNRFGIKPNAFSDFWIVAFSRQAFLFRKQHENFEWPKENFVRAGLPFIRIVAGYLKPTTVFVQRFGNLANQNTLTLNIQTIKELCKAGEINTREYLKDNVSHLSNGYVIIKIKGYDTPIGVGLLLEHTRLLCRFPKAIRMHLTVC